MKKLLLGLLVLGLMGCSDSDDNGPFDDNDLSGQYRACDNDPSVLFESTETTLDFSGSNFTVTTKNYSSDGCEGTVSGEESLNGTYTTSGNTIDYTYEGGAMIYDIYQVNGTTLRVGDRSGVNNGSTPELRPTEYDDLEYNR